MGKLSPKTCDENTLERWKDIIVAHLKEHDASTFLLGYNPKLKEDRRIYAARTLAKHRLDLRQEDWKYLKSEIDVLPPVPGAKANQPCIFTRWHPLGLNSEHQCDRMYNKPVDCANCMAEAEEDL